MRWNPQNTLPAVESGLVKYSGGFLAARPERWVPQISNHWMPIFHALGLTCKVVSVEPVIDIFNAPTHGYVGVCDDEPFAVAIAPETTKSLAQIFLPQAEEQGYDLVTEYLARRFIKSLAASWSGVPLTGIQFDSQLKISNLRPAAGIKVNLTANNKKFQIWILIGKNLLEKLDGQWRRQTMTYNKYTQTATEVSLELGSFDSVLTEVNKVLTKGNKIGLQRGLSEGVDLVANVERLAVAKLLRSSGKFALQIQNKTEEISLPDPNSLRVSVVLGKIELKPLELSLFGLPGSFIPTDLDINDQVELVISGQVAATATVQIENDQFFIVIN